MQDRDIDGNKLRDLRERRRLRRPQLAERAGISVSHLRHIETGGRQASRIVVLALSAALDCKIEEFTRPIQRAGAA